MIFGSAKSQVRTAPWSRGAQLAGSGVEFELVATVQGSYILLLDGDEPMTAR